MSQINLPPPESFEIPEHRGPASSDKPGKTYSIPPTNFAQKMETHPHEKEMANFKAAHKKEVEQHPEDVFVLPQILKQN